VTRAWRVVKTKYTTHALTGEGARLYGGRWTSPGIRVIHASDSLSLAMLEILVHLPVPGLLAHYSYFTFDLATSEIASIEDLATLPSSWRDSPPPAELRLAGNRWVREGSALALRVPSAIVPGQSNFLLNPLMGGFSSIAVQGPIELDLDDRLIGR